MANTIMAINEREALVNIITCLFKLLKIEIRNIQNQFSDNEILNRELSKLCAEIHNLETFIGCLPLIWLTPTLPES